MKATPFALALGAVASLAIAPASFAAICPNRVPTAITAPATEAARECQNAIAKAAASYTKAQLKNDAKCLSKQTPGTCPDAKDVAKNQKAALKSRDAIAKACASFAGLNNTYSAFGTADDVASCMLSQSNVEGSLLAYTLNGTPAVFDTHKDRVKCAKTINSAGVKYALGALQTINKCIASNIKANTAGNLAGMCVGNYNGVAFVPPTDIKTADKLSGLVTKLEASISKACAPVPGGLIGSIFACPGAASVADFQTCAACESWDTTLDLLAQQYNETGTFVANGPGAIQAAVDASGPNAKLLIQSGLYEESVSIANNVLHQGLQLVGCGGASGDRPRIDPPAVPGPNGITAGSVDDLLFQSLDLGPWPSNGVFVAQADGVSFRDVISDAEDISDYAVFPVESTDVLVELCDVRRVIDAGIYVGQAIDIVVRYNTVIENVAGIEIENSANASVHNNYAFGNTGGLLVFKLPDKPVMLSNDHEVFFNVSNSNNRANIGSGSVGTVPDGTGMLVLSNDDGDFHHNIMQGNNSFGVVLVDQEVINFLSNPAPDPFNPVSHACAAPDAPGIGCAVATQVADCPASGTCVPDQKSTGNKVHHNLCDDSNGTAPDNTGSNTTNGVGGPVVYAVFEEDPGPNFNNNCFESNGNPVNDVVGTALTNCP